MDSINRADLDWTETDHGEARWRRKRLGAATDGERLGASLYELPAGARSWPYHYHTGNEEALYVLAGAGRLRHDGDEHPLEPGDYVSLPEGEAGAHRVVNDGDDPLCYLAVSTMSDPDVLVYPDSEKVGVLAGAAPGGDGERTVDAFFRRSDGVDYWEGEKGE